MARALVTRKPEPQITAVGKPSSPSEELREESHSHTYPVQTILICCGAYGTDKAADNYDAAVGKSDQEPREEVPTHINIHRSQFIALGHYIHSSPLRIINAKVRRQCLAYTLPACSGVLNQFLIDALGSRHCRVYVGILPPVDEEEDAEGDVE